LVLKICAKETLERELSTYVTDRSEAFQNLYLHYKNQGEDEAAQSALITLLEEEYSVEAKYTLAFLYFDNQNTQQALNVLNSIPQQFNLDVEANEIHYRYQQLLDVLINMRENEISACYLDEQNAAALLQLSENTDDKPGKYARSILITSGMVEYEETVLLPDLNELKSGAIGKDENKKKEVQNLMVIHPNPAKDYFITEYNTHGSTKMQMQIFDTDSKLIQSFPLSGRNQKVVNTRDLPAGIYFIRLLEDNTLIEIHKLVVVK